MLLDELLIYSELIFTNNKVKKECTHIFLSPYYLYIKDHIKTIITKNNIDARYCRDIALQVVNYAFKNYFLHIYPFEYRLALQNKLFHENNSLDGTSDFITQISCSKEWITYLFSKYPILYNLIDVFSNNIFEYISELLNNFENDGNVLRSTYGINNSDLESICLFKGDLHNGRCVSLLSFKNGHKIYYKPRNADNEVFIQSFIKELNALGLNVNLGIPKFVSKENYSWHLHIINKGCNELSLSRYHYNWGILQCIFYVLGAQDIIPDNIVFSTGIPYIIDCEALVLRPYIYNDGDALSVYLQKSVLKTGILPDWMFDNASQRSSISSVLFKFRDGNRHLPRTSRKIFPMTRKDIPDFISGFSYAYNFLNSNKKNILDIINKYQINKLYSRVLIHPTMIYSCLLKEQMTIEYLAGKKTLHPLLSTLIRKDVYGKHAQVIRESIKQQIVLGNVPYFYSIGTDRCLYTNMTQLICGDFYNNNTNLEWVTNKFNSLSNKDLSYQVNIIEETLKFYFDVIDDKLRKREITLKSEVATSRNLYLHASLEIYKRIEKYEIQVEHLIGYIGRTKCLYDSSFQIALHNNSIYDGLAGICMFYMHLYRQTLDKKIYHKAKTIFQQICSDIANIRIDKSEYKNIAISPLTGITGVLYLMECFHNDLLDYSTYTNITNKLHEIIPITEQYDYMSGIAGLVCFLYQAKLINKTERIALMKLCGQRLLELGTISSEMISWRYLDGGRYASKRSMVLGGYSHGSASICVAFYMLYLETADVIFKEAFQKALKHDRSYFSYDIQGWIDGRDNDNQLDSGSWCHGSAGIALSRLQLLSLGYYDSLIKDELNYAILQIKKRLKCNLSICHGVMGNLEILHALKNYGCEINCDLELYEEMICKDICSQLPIWCGDDNYDSLIGLFMGISGIGYQLIRINAWTSSPSIMCLETNCENKFMH